jgi:hypothetical protein
MFPSTNIHCRSVENDVCFCSRFFGRAIDLELLVEIDVTFWGAYFRWFLSAQLKRDNSTMKRALKNVAFCIILIF